jgi:cysteine desulfurase
MTSVYLDYNATTPTDPRVVESMLPYFTEMPGNAASVDHDAGYTAAKAVEHAREQVAELVGARPAEVIFTSGATEADNLAILGSLAHAGESWSARELVISAIEHPAVSEAATAWGDRVRVVGVDSDGVVDPDAVSAAITPRTAMVSIMVANNETGAVQPISEIAAICAEAGIPLHTDAVQAAARLPQAGGAAAAAAVSISAHKMYGPKGVGALIIRRATPRLRVDGLHYGGGHERGLRPGTLNVPGIVGFGRAAQLVCSEGASDAAREQNIKERLLAGLRDASPGLVVNGDPQRTLPQTLNIRLPGIDGHALLRLLSGDVAISTGSACTTTSVKPSPVLLAQGLSPGQISESIRLSFGRMTTDADVERALLAMTAAILRLRPLARTAAA